MTTRSSILSLARRAGGRAKANLRRGYKWVRRALIPADRKLYEMERLVGPIGYWYQLQTYQGQLLTRVGMRPHHRLLDVGAGPLQGGVAFISYLDPGKYVGIDISEHSLNVAYRQIYDHRLAAKNPRLVRSTSFGAAELAGETFDYIWASQVLYHLDSQLIAELFGAVARFLADDGVFLGDVMIDRSIYPWVTDESAWNGYKFHMHPVSQLTAIAHDSGLILTDMGVIGDYGYPETRSLKANTLIKLQRSVS